MGRYSSDFIESLDSRIYWEATKDVYDSVFEEYLDSHSEQEAAVRILNDLTEITKNSQQAVEEIQKERYESGEIQDMSQSTVSVVGNNFQALVGYALEINRLVGNIPEGINVVLKPKRNPIAEEFATIEVAEGVSQKPDMDLLLHTEDESEPIMILSCKTSLRERAGQTYRWRLLMDIATCDCEHEEGCPMDRYDLTYDHDREILLSLVTADFYDERTAEQQKGTFTFFDDVFVTKGIDEFGNVRGMSKAVERIDSAY